jgi:tetratricopeptide (TPR) repeat protein
MKPSSVSRYWASRAVDFTLLRLIQILLGGATCVLVFFLTKKLTGEERGALVGGLMAALCGTLAYYDGLLLGTTLELFLLCASLLVLAGSRRASTAAVSGALLGLAILVRPNLLLFAAFALVWILAASSRPRWSHAALFALGCFVAISPMTIRNYMAADDFVAVSSGAGVNLFIGNNPHANGYMTIPPGSGLEITSLFESSRAAAEEATGTSAMKPSSVSRYWASRAVDFMLDHPARTLGLLVTKLRLFWNHYEIPNLHNKYFLADAYTPSLRWLFVGFGLIAPLALVGMVLELRRSARGATTGLYLGFVITYMCSVVPFFVTSRYRVAVVPLLIVFAAAGLRRVTELARERRFGWLGVAVVVGAGSAVWVGQGVTEANYAFGRTVAGMAHVDIALEEPEDAAAHLNAGIVELKKALELSPGLIAPHYHLGLAYRRSGFERKAVAEFTTVLGYQPSNRFARDALETAPGMDDARDTADPGSMPMTPLERAMEARKDGDMEGAEKHLRRAIDEDPQHTFAHYELGVIYHQRKDYAEAARWYGRGLRFEPENFRLLENLGATYALMGKFARARECWERCLEIRPGDENIRRGIRTLDAKMREDD